MLSQLEVTLLSAAVVIFSWATNTFNCGLLNYIFTVTLNNTIALTQTSILSAITTAVYQNLFQGGSRNLEVYKWLPIELQDGSGLSHHVAILTGVTVIISILLFMLPLSVIVVSCNCQRCFRGDEITTIMNESQEKDIYHDAYFLEKIHAQTLEAIKSSDRNDDRFNLCHIVMFVVTFLLIAALAISIGVLFISSFMVTNMLNEDNVETVPATFTPDNFTILTGVKYIFSRFLSFLDTGINSGKASTEGLLKDINSTFMNSLEIKISKAVDELLCQYGVQPLIQTGEYLQADLQVLQTTMEYIRLNNQQVSQEISQLVGQFSTIHSLIVPELNKVCSVQMGSEIDALCDILKTRASILIIHFNASAIKVDPPAVLNFIFTDLGVDLTQILEQFSNFTAKIIDVKDHVLIKVASFLDFNSMFAPIMQVWDTLSQAATSISGNLTEITKSVTKGINGAQSAVHALVYIPLVLIFALLIANAIIAILYAIEAKQTQIFYANHSDCKDSSHVCSNIGNLIHAVIFMVFILLLSILVTILLPTVTMLTSDGCAYIVEQQGVAQADYVINSYVANEVWPSVVKGIESHIQPPVGEYLVLASPLNLINASTVVCGQSFRSTSSIGLLGAIGWNTIISIPKIFASPDVQKKIQEGEEIVKQEILNQNLPSLIPSDLDQIVKTAQNLTQYFDGVDYQPSIDELSPSKLPTNELANYVNDLETLNMKIKNLGLPVSNILQECANLIRSGLVTAQNVGKHADALRNAFIEAQARRNLTTGINGLVKGIEEVKKIFANEETILAPVTPIYWRLIDSFKVDIEVDLNPVIKSFLHKILPCFQIYTAANALLEMVCKQSGGLSRVFTWLYVLTISGTITTLLFFSTFQLGFIQTHHFRRLKYAPKIVSPAKTCTTERYVPYPSPRGRRIASISYISPPNAQKERQDQQKHRLAEPIPAIYACTDRQDFNSIKDLLPVEDPDTQDAVSEIPENSIYEVSNCSPVPTPPCGNCSEIQESESLDEVPISQNEYEIQTLEAKEYEI